MSKTLEGYVDDGKAAPLANVSTVVTVVGAGTVVTSGVTDSDGHWYFDGLDEGPEYFVNVIDVDGNAVVRGPWSGEVRDVWVRDRLAVPDTATVRLPNSGATTVGDLPLALAPDAGNALEWRAGGLYTESVLGLSEAEADLRYEPIDTAYTKAEADALFLTEAAADLLYSPIDAVVDAYTKAESDARYAELTDVDPFPQYLTPAEASATYLTPAAADALFLTQAEGDARYPLLTAPDPYPIYLTQAEADTLYASAAGSGITQAQADLRYIQLTGGSVLTGLLGPTTTNTRDLGTTALRWRKLWSVDGEFTNTPTVGGTALPTFTSADARYLQLTGGSVMTGLLGPSTTNTRDLGTTALRWRKLWAVDGEFTNPPTVGGVALPTVATADAAYVNASGDTMTGWLTLAANTWQGMSAQGYGTGVLGLVNVGAARGTLASPLPSQDADWIGQYNFERYANGAWRRAIELTGMADGAATTTNYRAALIVKMGTSAGGSVDRLKVDPDGRVWVNPLTDPALPAAFTSQPGLLVQHEGTDLMGLSLAKAETGAGAERLNFWRTRGTWASKVAIANTDFLGSIESHGWSGSQWLNNTYIRSYVQGAVSTSVVPGALRFGTADSAGVLTDRLWIGPSGLIGVGAKADGSATATLDVQAAAAATVGLIVRNHASAAATLGFFQAHNSAGSQVVLGASNNGIVTDVISATAIGTYATKRIPVYNSSGTLQGYLPLYS